MPITELPTTAPTSLGPDKIDKRVYAGEAYRIQAFLVNKIRQYLIDIGGEVGLSDGSTPGSLVARVVALEAGGGGGGTNAQSIWSRAIYNGAAPTNGQTLVWNNGASRWEYGSAASPSVRTFTLVVGNQAAGDTSQTCDYLDTGNGAGIQAALAAAAALSPLRVCVFVRRGTYTLSYGTLGAPLTVPAGCTLMGEGEYATIFNTFPGASGVNMTTLILAAGSANAKTTLCRVGLRVPANDAAVPASGARGIVNYNAYTKMEDIDAVVAAGTQTNALHLFFQADYATAYPHGVEMRRVHHDASAATATSANGIYTITLRCTAVAPTAGAQPPVVEDLTYIGSTAAGTGRAIYSPCPTLEARRIRAFSAQAAVYVVGALTYGGTVRGPRIEDVVNDTRGFTGSYPVQIWSTIINHTTSGTLTISATSVTNSALLYDTANIDTGSQVILSASTGVTYTDATLQGVKIVGTTNAGIPMEVSSSAPTGYLDGVTVSDCGGRTAKLRVRSGVSGGAVYDMKITGCDFYSVVFDGAGTVSNTIFTGNTVRQDFVINTATITNTLVTGNRLVGTVTDSGTGTSMGLNITGA